MRKPAESTAQTSAGLRAAIPAAIFLVVFITHLNGVITSVDSRWSIPIARSLLREGNIDLDEYTTLLEANRFYAIESINGHYYSIFPIGVSLLAVPVVYTIDAAGVTLSDKKTERLVASLIVALTATLLYLIAPRAGAQSWAAPRIFPVLSRTAYRNSVCARQTNGRDDSPCRAISACRSGGSSPAIRVSREGSRSHGSPDANPARGRSPR